MQILPVIDLQSGQVVRGVAGQRASYRPVESQLCSSSDPVTVAAAITQQFDLREFYLADLDAISGRDLQFNTISRLVTNDFALHVDAGVNHPSQAEMLLKAGVQSIIVGLETLVDPSQISTLRESVQPDCLIFSLDMHSGNPITSIKSWQTEPQTIIERVVSAGISKIILLDLHDVGTNQGLSTLRLLKKVIGEFPETDFIIGGGIRHVADLTAAQSAGASAVLIASALHSGRITKADLLPFSH